VNRVEAAAGLYAVGDVDPRALSCERSASMPPTAIPHLAHLVLLGGRKSGR
jgi:hypothetical protein